MADRGLIHYQPLTGPVWREPVAAALAWLPRGEPARPLERRIPSEFVYPPFYELYQPSGLHWLPSGRWPIYPEVRKLGDFQQPPFQALYQPEQLGWMPSAYYVGRAAPRGVLDSTVAPLQFAAPVFDPQNLEWIPKGPPPQTFLEVRKLGDFAQPAFDALYKPEGLQWLFEGQLSVWGIPYTLQSSWVIDPSPVATVVFDPQFFPFQATDLVLARTLQGALQSDFSTPPLPPGPDVIVVPDTGLGGSSAVHPRRIIYEKGTKRKPKTFIDRIGEPFLELEKTPEPVPDAAAAGAVVHDASKVRSALEARLPAPLPLSVSTPLVVRPLDDDEDDDLLLLS